MALEGGTRLVQDEGFSAVSVVRSMGFTDVPRDAGGDFGFVAGRMPEDVVVAHRPMWDDTVEEHPPHDDAFDARVEAVVIITSPFNDQPSGRLLQKVGMTRLRVPAYCCYTDSAEPTTQGARRFLLLAHDKPGHASAARRDEWDLSSEVWCAVVDAAPGSGEPAELVEEIRTNPTGLAAIRARITERHGKHEVIDLPATDDVEKAAHAAAVRCALTHQH